MAATAPQAGTAPVQEPEALGVTPTEVARQLRLPANRITLIIVEQRDVTGDHGLRLRTGSTMRPNLDEFVGSLNAAWPSSKAFKKSMPSRHGRTGNDNSARSKRGLRRNA